MSDTKPGAEQIGPTRLHVPGQPPPGQPQFRNMVVKDAAGNVLAMPFVYAAAMDENFAKQLYAAVRAAVSDSVKDIVVGLCSMVITALRPATVEPPPQDVPQETTAAEGEHPTMDVAPGAEAAPEAE